MEERKEDMPHKPGKKKGILHEDGGKRTPPEPTGYVTGGDTPATRPEQGPDVPPQERTQGIP
ncbi:hypothetical protein [Pontibacter flavimaris]|uniref:Uncharacterized protein n=1 Tax=Pontibacter flavimaris TaxID=1797110 RepID=A0A1Q5PHT1_9BACT|nr:hypothetical protein [Pontibacter flavimaris]OKL41767.1 hypothetical protein A3841_09880 [Pontibacter flavimaris]